MKNFDRFLYAFVGVFFIWIPFLISIFDTFRYGIKKGFSINFNAWFKVLSEKTRVDD